MPKPRRSATAGTALLALACGVLLLPAGAPAAKKRPVNVNAHVSVRAHVALGYTQLSPSDRPKARISQAGCPGAALVPSAENLDAVRSAILCLTNAVRSDNDLPLLRGNARLRRAATAHSTDMVERGFFEHTSPGGTTMVDRIFHARYATRDQGWAFGENLAWGTGRMGTPQGVFDSWMRSSGHKANILRRSYRDVGIGVVSGVPTGGSAGATYTSDFGVRR